jgi:hypothetical protein
MKRREKKRKFRINVSSFSSIRLYTSISLALALYIYSSFLFALLLLLLLASLPLFFFRHTVVSTQYIVKSTHTYSWEYRSKNTPAQEKRRKWIKKDKRSSTLQETEQCICMRVYIWEWTRDLLSKYIGTEMYCFCMHIFQGFYCIHSHNWLTSNTLPQHVYQISRDKLIYLC